MGSIELASWLEAVGTLLAVMVALFYNSIRDWWRKPNINIDFEDKEPFIEQKEAETESSRKSSELRIRIRVKNNGKTTALHSLIIIDSYDKKREKDDVYVEKVFLPKTIKDSKNSTQYNIAPRLNYFFDFAIIKKYDGMTENNTNTSQKQFYKLYLLGDSKTLQLGKGTFIIPINFYGAKCDSKTSYIKVYWDSDDFTIEKSSFGVNIITQKEFEKLKKAK